MNTVIGSKNIVNYGEQNTVGLKIVIDGYAISEEFGIADEIRIV